MLIKGSKFLGIGLALVILALAIGIQGQIALGQDQPQSSCTVTVTPGQSIQEAIDSAPDGAVICLEPGEWKGNLVIEKSLTLRAAEIEPEPDVVIKSAKAGQPVILIKSDQEIEVRIEGLKVTGAFGNCYKLEPEWICPYGIEIRGHAKAVIQNNTISDNWWKGISMEGSSQATIENNTISDNEQDGISMEDSSQTTITNNTISGNGDGISMEDSSQTTIEKNTISDNGDGISMEDSSQTTITNNTISGNRCNGIGMQGSSQVTIQNSTISGNKYGIEMKGSSQATIQNSTISGNKYGIEMKGSSQATIESNTIQDNSQCGISSYSDKPAKGEGNNMSGNGVDLRGNLSARLRIPLAPETTQKELSFPGPYSTLQETIDALAPGGTIKVAAGEHQGGLTIWKPLTLSGVHKELVTVKGALSLIDEAKEVTIEGVTITDSPISGLFLGGSSQATITNNTIRDNKGEGIEMEGSSQATITNNTIRDNWDGILMWGSSQATIQNSTISDNEIGISMEDSSQVTIQNSTISDNKYGIEMKGSSQATIESNTIQDNSQCGISSYSDKPAKGEGNNMSGNGVDLRGNLSARLRIPLVPETKEMMLSFPGPYSTLQETIDALAPGGTIKVATGEHQGGLTIWKPLTLSGVHKELVTVKGVVSLINEAQGVTIEGVAITDSPISGLFLGGSSQATITNNTIRDNKGEGIEMQDSSQAAIINNTIRDNAFGILMAGSSQATITNNTIRHNNDGISMLGSSLATITNNTIRDNNDGILMWGSSQATITNNNIRGNEADGILMQDSSRVAIENNTISDSWHGIRIGDSSQATITNNNITSNLYGVVVGLGICFDSDECCAGEVDGSGNEIHDNGKGDVCPIELQFLTTQEGGCYGPECEKVK